MNLNPQTITFTRKDDALTLVIDGKNHAVDRVARAFPQSDPDRFIGFLDAAGHEIGIVENLEGMDETSRALLQEELKILYFVPTVEKIQSVEAKGTGSVWNVLTDDGEYTFRILGRDALNGTKPPAIEITSETSKKFRIENYWELDAGSQDAMRDFIPDQILKARYARISSPGSSGRGVR
jgi:hypothetical protein